MTKVQLEQMIRYVALGASLVAVFAFILGIFIGKYLL